MPNFEKPLPWHSLSLRWLALVSCATGAGQLLHAIGVPAGLFIGPMLVAIIFGVCGFGMRLNRHAFRFGQGCIGLLAAQTMTASVLLSIAASWHIMLIATLTTICLSALIGIGSVRIGNIPGSTAAWGTAPGAASAMVAMAEDYGADARVVATMQYVRVVCVVMAGALVSHLMGASTETGVAATASEGMYSIDFILGVGVILTGLVAGLIIPAGGILAPLFIGSAMQLSGLINITLPSEFMALGYGLIGCYIGLRFDRATLVYVVRRLPSIFVGAIILILLCAGCAGLLTVSTGADFLSMYLATSPGGLDAMAIIAVESNSDVGLVLAMQTLRLLGVVLTGAFVAKQIIRLTGGNSSVSSQLR
ncbi:AbrB family transcriptional regulator [Pseudomonas argentinensis]|uniref:Uncharacterized protein n=1 Tax=Phytopseudomonas argentinensis TaxID=289370 RepID=A0A1I3N8A4_9GAMM|nr:AbrB family transcriptional regulator [Pseudomonas argentinensis]KAB0550119.1 AbrB family transcriptional regulator [Pseudomonas argentinensis]SFJ05345.1 hypothetical protein SAMN05216602_3660 [Pseudomonas argentinensis]